jgi:hypothetical protein
LCAANNGGLEVPRKFSSIPGSSATTKNVETTSGTEASVPLDDRFGKLVACQLNWIASGLKPSICLRLEAARMAAVAHIRQQ